MAYAVCIKNDNSFINAWQYVYAMKHGKLTIVVVNALFFFFFFFSIYKRRNQYMCAHNVCIVHTTDLCIGFDVNK